MRWFDNQKNIEGLLLSLKSIAWFMHRMHLSSELGLESAFLISFGNIGFVFVSNLS